MGELDEQRASSSSMWNGNYAWPIKDPTAIGKKLAELKEARARSTSKLHQPVIFNQQTLSTLPADSAQSSSWISSEQLKMERSKVLPLRSLLGEDDLTFGSEDGDDRTRTMGKTQRPEEQVEERIVRSVVIDDDLSLSSGDDEGDECTITAEKSSSWTSSDQHQITRLEVPSLRSLLGEDDYTFGSKDGDDRTRTMEKTQRPEVEERIIRSVVIDDDLSLSSEDDEGDECTIMAEIQMPEVAAEERIVRSVVIDDDMSLSCDDGEDEDDGSTTKVTRSRPTDPVELAVQVPTVRSVFGDDDLSSSSDDEEEEEQQRHKENEQQCQPTPRPPEQGTDENIGSDRSTKFVENRQNGKLTDFDDMPGLHDWWTL